MQGYDLLMIGVMVVAIFRGYSKGLAWQVSSIASIAVSYLVACRFKDVVSTKIEMPAPWNGLVAMMVLFVGSSLLIWFLFQVIRDSIEKAKLKDFDQQLGAIFGGIKGVAWCTAITLLALSFLQPATSQEIVNSRSGGYIARILASSKAIMPAEVQELVQPFIRRAEEQLQQRAPQDSDLGWPTGQQWEQAPAEEPLAEAPPYAPAGETSTGPGAETIQLPEWLRGPSLPVQPQQQTNPPPARHWP